MSYEDKLMDYMLTVAIPGGLLVGWLVYTLLTYPASVYRVLESKGVAETKETSYPISKFKRKKIKVQ